MSTQRYSATPQPIDVLLAWVKSGEIAIPEIQHPFVWEPTKVRHRDETAPSGLDWFSMTNPGRCPGLVWHCPFGVGGSPHLRHHPAQANAFKKPSPD